MILEHSAENISQEHVEPYPLRKSSFSFPYWRLGGGPSQRMVANRAGKHGVSRWRDFLRSSESAMLKPRMYGKCRLLRSFMRNCKN